MKCEKCEAEVGPGESFQHSGKNLCEDCYLDLKTMPKTCDPWAVHSAKNMPAHQASLTPIQEQILGLIRGKGPLSAVEICQELRITEQEFQRQFASLRHMELARGFKSGDQICFTTF